MTFARGRHNTALGASKRGGRVTTTELDPAMTQMYQANPRSRELLGGETRQLCGDAADVVPNFPDASFDRVIHDPHALALAGKLFGGELYGHLRRILASKGRLCFGGVAIEYAARSITAAHDPVKINSKTGPQKSFGKPAERRGRPRTEGGAREATKVLGRVVVVVVVAVVTFGRSADEADAAFGRRGGEEDTTMSTTTSTSFSDEADT